MAAIVDENMQTAIIVNFQGQGCACTYSGIEVDRIRPVPFWRTLDIVDITAAFFRKARPDEMDAPIEALTGEAHATDRNPQIWVDYGLQTVQSNCWRHLAHV